ncbi:putative RNA-directed DNA polymerase [Tanacetum coccineum]
MRGSFVNCQREQIQPGKYASGDASIWYLDNGESNHMTGTKSHFKDIDESVSRRVRFGDGSYVQIKGRGSILLGCRNHEQKIVSEALSTFKEFRQQIEMEMRMKLRMLRTDRGSEFTSNEFTRYCKENGIARQLTAPYSPQQNGVVERRNRTMLSTTRSMMKAMKLPLTLLGRRVDNENATPVNTEINDNVDNTYQEQDPITDPNSPITPPTYTYNPHSEGEEREAVMDSSQEQRSMALYTRKEGRLQDYRFTATVVMEINNDQEKEYWIVFYFGESPLPCIKSNNSGDISSCEIRIHGIEVLTMRQHDRKFQDFRTATIKIKEENVINDNLLNVCAILESHVDIGKLERVCNKVFVKWKWASNSRFCTKGSRIIIGWNDNVVDVVVLSCTSQAIHTQVMHKADSKVMFCTFVYASNSYETRREFWYSLEMHKQFVNTRPWVIMGDFNAALFIEDTFHGSNDINISMRDFNDRVNKIEIADVNSTGLHGIRSQKEKLVSKNKPKPFKFFNLLAYKPDFMQLVTEHWKMEFKLFNLIRHELDEVQMALDNDPSSIILREEEAVYLTDFTQATLDEERFLKQKSKIEWLQVEILILRNLEGLFVRRLSTDKAANMICCVLDDEIQSAMFSVRNDKAPGPDGYTLVFFKKSWDVVHTILYDIVSDNQSAFVPGRSISDNMLLTQEFMHNYHLNRGPPKCVFKIDIQKAYDMVNWKLLEDILVAFGFHSNMVKWIMACVTNTSFSININGNLHGYFKGKRGLRQGDPMSPYLFTLVMEIVTLILKRKVQEDGNFTYHHKCGRQKIINICFADDLIMFARGDVQSARILMEALDEFKRVSRLVPSIPKGTLFVCNVLDHVKNDILQLMPFERGTLPVKYLGVPLISSQGCKYRSAVPRRSTTFKR